MALFFSRAVLGRICMLCLPVFACCQLMHPASGSISCFPPCMQQRVGQLQIDLTHRDQLAEILTQNQTMQAGGSAIAPAIRFGCAAAAAAHGKAAKGPHSPQLLTGVGSQHLWSVHFSGMGSLCDMRCSYRGVALWGRLCDDQNMLMGGRQGLLQQLLPLLRRLRVGTGSSRCHPGLFPCRPMHEWALLAHPSRPGSGCGWLRWAG
jgi:hypothetical protein